MTRLDAFYTEHRQCGDLDAGVDGRVVWIACPCGANNGATGGRARRTCLQRLTCPIVPSWTAGLSRALLNLAERDGRASYPQFTARRGMPT
jgi:hypothetical protein